MTKCSSRAPLLHQDKGGGSKPNAWCPTTSAFQKSVPDAPLWVCTFAFTFSGRLGPSLAILTGYRMCCVAWLITWSKTKTLLEIKSPAVEFWRPPTQAFCPRHQRTHEKPQDSVIIGFLSVLHPPLSEVHLEADPPVSTRYKYMSLDITTFPCETKLGLFDVPNYTDTPNLTIYHFLDWV